MSPLDNYLDITNILLYQFFGDPVIMYWFFFILIAYCCLKFAVPEQPSLMLLIMYTTLFFIIVPTTWSKALYTIAVLGVGALLYWYYARRLIQ